VKLVYQAATSKWIPQSPGVVEVEEMEAQIPGERSQGLFL
jgi:hypothetical protein